MTFIPIVLDFESYHDKDYSLKKLPTMQYIRDPRFDCLGCAVKLPGKPSVWIPPERLEATLAALPWDRVMMVAHNCQFDAAVLVERYGHRPARYACTMFMLRYLIAQGALDPELRTSLDDAAPLVGMEKGDLDTALESGALDDYATLDADICAALFEQYWRDLPEVERDYIHIHVQAAAEAVFDLDLPRLRKMADADKALETLFPIVRKDDKFAAALDALGVPPEWKTTAKGTYKLATAKTDAFMQRLHAHPDERVRKLAEIRTKAGSTIERTRCQRFIDIGAPLPAPLLYHGAHTARSSGKDAVNVQNLKRDGDMRRSIRAPEGHKLVIVDSSQIEVRVNAWLAGQEDLLDEFRRGVDPYKSFASYLYGVEVDGVAPPQRQVAKAAVLALGFGQGANGFENFCASSGVEMSPALATRTVAMYRRRYDCIRAHWREAERDLREQGHTPLPNGDRITYPSLRIGDDGLEFQRHSIFRKAKSEGFTNLWHGKIVENCLATNTEILTCQGWLPLDKVSTKHRVWDGVEWVNHDGFVNQGVQETLWFGGVQMTPDHKVWTPRGFVPAAEAEIHEATRARERLDRAPGRPSGCDGISGQRRAPVAVADSVRLRSGPGNGRVPLREGRSENMRAPALHDRGTVGGAPREEPNSRHEQAPIVRGVARHAGAVSEPETPRLAQLWGPRDNGVPPLGDVREVLGRHGADVPPGPDDRPGGQRRGVRPGELPVGNAQTAKSEPETQRISGYAPREDDRRRGIREERYKSDDPAVPEVDRLARREDVRPASRAEVGDILNAGPRRRFLVRGREGETFFVSNCVQRVARDVVFEQSRRLWLQGWRIVLMVHDETVLCVPDDRVDEAVAACEAAFTWTPDWAKGLPVAGEVKVSREYMK